MKNKGYKQMKQIIAFLLLFNTLTVNAQKNFWEDPTIVEEGKEPARTFFIPFNGIDELKSGNPENSSHIQVLNGIWKFSFAGKVADRPTDFFEPGLNDSNWKNILVPGSWETQGFGIPVYTNIDYIFPENPPFVNNNDLPIGSYRKTFILDKKMADKEIILHFGSIAGAATIYVNGKRVGYSKVSKTPAEFNITHFLQSGENILAVQIFKWSDASYLEDQDFWRLAGIERDVFLIARPKVSIEDFFVVGDLDPNYKNGILTVDVNLRNFTTRNSEKHSVIITMTDQHQKKIFSKTLPVKSVDAKGTHIASIKQEINNPAKWSAEFPNIYIVSIELKDNSGKSLEVTSCQTGFRKIEIRNKQLLINGKPIIIRGTNLHEHHEKFGHYVDKATMLKDIQLMKQYNLNAIRTSHYPQSPDFYELCNKYGFYVVNEANIEAHGLDGMPQHQHPSSMAEWKGQHMDRTIRMFERDKNHPCVIVWSLGNESDFGTNYEATYNWLKNNDKANRPVQFERARGNAFTDIMCPMYNKPDAVEKYAKDTNSSKPYIMCEYAHSMGNSTGNFQEYWDLFMKYPILQGGFIWDWVDQGLEAYNFEGNKYWIYGGDLGGHRWTHDENFCNNGLVNPDRTIHPALNEVKKAYQPIWFKAVDLEKGIINIQNYNLFTNLSAYNYYWKLFENWKLTASGTFTAEGKPLESTDVKLQLPPIRFKPGHEYFLVVEACQQKTTDLVEAGHVIATEQFAFPQNNYFITLDTKGNLEVSKTDKELCFKSGDTEGKINLQTGKLTSYTYKEIHLITDQIRANFWRAPIDNDFGDRMPWRLNIWRTADNNMIIKSVEVKEQCNKGIVVESKYRFLGLDIEYSIIYTILNDASVRVTSTIDMKDLDLPELPRFGIKMLIPFEFENVTYYGRGPWENYSDRNTSSFIGMYHCKVDALNFDYSRPQENGYRTDVRLVSFSDEKGNGILFEGFNGPVCFNARYNSDDDLDPGLTKKQQHHIDIQKQNKLFINIDYGQMGVGGNDSWGAYPLDKYRLLGKKYSYSFVMRPLL